jgi:transcriptional antiterminator RfaH
MNRWYVIHTKHREEERANSNLQAWGVETFNPRIKERCFNKFTAKPFYMNKPLFTRYIFARFNAKALLHKVWYTRGVHSVVSFGSGPTPVDDEIVAIMQSQIRKDGFINMDDLKCGDKVVIKDGPFKTLCGTLDQVSEDSHHVMILLSSLNYQGRIMIERALVQRASQKAVAYA